ncbi:reverse transcriptase [Phytophthora megakarya]|uniref:Reverse transcriptase n=1 Tax=Phytophthora megakarya TaxID=4795 RepID=A0A225VRK7_9STRA|nr:reverse transcriptase [Phytophthora megakarya]
MIDNALYGFIRIPKSEDHGGALDVFENGESMGPGKPSVLGRRSYIDDILIPANNWDQLCDRAEGLLKACDEWNLSISVVKRFWGMLKVEYLGHRVSQNGLEANPKDLSALTDLAFPGSLRAKQSFLGSLNYYSRFNKDYAIYASVLYELREIDFVTMMKEATEARIQQILEVENVDQESQEDQGVDQRRTLDLEAPDLTEVDPRWIHAHRSFSVLKTRIATNPILRHFDPDRRATVVVYASDWAVSGSLMQEYDQIYYPVMFASRTLKSTALQRRLGQWAALLSPWAFEITKCVKGKDEILGALAASITPRSEVDKALISIAPKKKPRRKIQAPIPTNRRDEELYVVSFDGSDRVKRGGGAYSAILWKLPEWRVLKARSGYAEGLTVNEAEYHGLLLCLDLLEDLDTRRLVICGDSNMVIRQVRGEIDCSLREESVRELRIERIRQAQDEESWIMGLKKYLVGEIRDLTQEEAKMFGSIAMNYEADQLDLLFYCPTTKETAADRDKMMRLMIPETLQQDILHHYHTSKGRPRIQGDPPGNLQATHPFQIIAMDHILSLPRSFNGNTELLIFVDLFSGYVISASRSAQTIAETYEECVFRRFGASEVIRHDREPGFKSFNKTLGQRQRATMTYRPQANGSAERMVHTTTQALKMYVEDLDQRD